MGNPIRKKADELGLMNLTPTILYAQPSSVRQTFSRCVPNTDRALKTYINTIDTSFIDGRTGGVKAFTYSILAPNAKIYVEDTDQYVGWAHSENNHVLKVSIYTDSEEKTRNIAQVIDSIFPTGLLANIDWNKIQKKYDINQEECVATWRKLLDNEWQKSEKNNQVREFKFCEKCGKKNSQKNRFCIECGQEF